MKASELLKPRYEVIASYPGSEFEVGEVVQLNRSDENKPFRYLSYQNESGPEVWYTHTFQEYPHIFRKMNWWEQRSADQMPDKIKHTEGDVYYIIKWDMEKAWGHIDNSGRGCGLNMWPDGYGYEPID